MKASRLLGDLINKYEAKSAKSGQITGFRSKGGGLFFRKECNCVQVYGNDPSDEEFADVKDYLHNVVGGLKVLDDDSGFIEVWTE